MSEKKGLKSESVVNGLVIAFLLCVTIMLLSIFGIAEVWPASIALLFFFEAKTSIKNIKNIFLGAAAGILLALALVEILKLLGPVMGEKIALLLSVFIFVFLIIALGDVSHMVFNNYTFCYFTVALITKEQASINWLIALVVGGGLLVGAAVLFTKLSQNKESDKSINADVN